MHRSISLFVFDFIFQFEKWVLSYLLLDWFISDSLQVGTVFWLENSFGSWYVKVFTVLWVSSDDKFLNALRTFHSELINFGGVEIINPSFNGIESHTFCDHILTAIASDMERSLISNFTSPDSFAFNNFEGFVFTKIAFLGRYILRIVIFGNVEIVSSCCG